MYYEEISSNAAMTCVRYRYFRSLIVIGDREFVIKMELTNCISLI